MERVGGRGKGSIWRPSRDAAWSAYRYAGGRWVRTSTRLKHRSMAYELAQRWLREGEHAELTGDVAVNHSQRAIREHIDDFARENRSNPRGLTPQHIERKITSIRAMVRKAGWERITHITLQSTQDLLTRLRLGESLDVAAERDGAGEAVRGRPAAPATGEDVGQGRSPRTLNLYRAYLKNFTRWLHRKGRIAMDPLAGLERFRTAGHETFSRRALTVAEQHRLVRAAIDNGPLSGISGQDRAMLYRFALCTGFRKSECASLTPASFLLDAKVPHVRLKGKDAKNKSENVEQPLPRSMVADLRVWLAGRPRSSPCWPGLGSISASKLVARDLRRARIDVSTELGRVDFHALRHTFATTLARANVTPKRAQQLLRHKSMDLTMLIYSHVEQSELATSLDDVFGAASGGPKVAGEACRNLAVTGNQPESAGADAASVLASGAESHHERETADMCVQTQPEATGDEWDGRDSNPRLRDYESPDGDSKSLTALALAARASDGLQLACSPDGGDPAADGAGPAARRGSPQRRRSARQRADAGLVPDLDRAFGHIRDLGLMASVPAAEGGAA